jgi:hypothetical protein
MRTVQRCGIRHGFVLGAQLLWAATGVCAAASNATITGVVRDTQGVAQMGALVEALSAASGSVSAAFTDMAGRYRIANLAPGTYRVRASAALFVPATRGNLRLTTGMRATVNLTLNMLSDPAAWLPAQRRKPDEPGDDWTWTLRSAANRPILRAMGDGSVVLVSSGAREGQHGAPMEVHVSMMSGDGGFGEGGMHGVVALDRGTRSGSDLMLRADVAAQGMNSASAPAMEIDAGQERRGVMGGGSRMAVSYASHPEMMSSGAGGENVMGMQAMRMASAEKMQLGDTVEVEAGGTVYAIHTVGSTLTAQPFLRVTVHPGEVWAVRYRLATARDVQEFDGLDSIAAELPVAVVCGARLCTESGTHQEIAVSRKTGGGRIEASVYHDAIGRTAIAGTGATGPAELTASDVANGVVVDTATGSFRLLGAGTTTNGVSVTLSEPLTENLWAALEFASGAALKTGSGQGPAGLQPDSGEAATVAVSGRVLRAGTKLRAAYRWQPRRMVTAVGPYEAFSDQAYLSFTLRQALRCGDMLPPGVEATIDVSNLLAEGYQPFLSADGQTLFLAQSPRTIQGGLSFTF